MKSSVLRSAHVLTPALAFAIALAACPAEKITVSSAPRAAALEGEVLDENGAPIAGAVVTVAGRAVATRGDGHFAVADLPEGSSTLEVGIEGSVRLVRPIRVAPGADPAKFTVSRPQGLEVVFTGDVMFGRRYLDRDGTGTSRNALARVDDAASFERIVARIAPYTRGADLTIPNVETAFGLGGVAHPSKPFVFISPPASVAALRAIGADVALLANNHTYDFFQDGMQSTLDALRSHGIATVGGGLDEQEAYRPVVVEARGTTMGLANFCGLRICGVRTGDGDLPDEPPYQDALGDRGGVAKLSADALRSSITALRTKTDRVTVVLHSGNEYVAEPTPGQVSAAHKAIELGADLVVGHHPHVLQPFEAKNGKLIAYSLGNLVFDQDFHETWISTLLRVRWPATRDLPLLAWSEPIYLDDYIPHLATGRLGRHILRLLGETSAPRGVTVLEDGWRGRLVLDATMITSADETRTQTPKPIDRGGLVDLETDLGPRTFVAAVEGPGVIWVGRDVLRVGSFEADLVGAPFENVVGWNTVSDVQGITTDDPRDGDRALRICRDLSSTGTSGLSSAGRIKITEGRSYSLCGCVRGGPSVVARVELQYFGSIQAGEKPLAKVTGINETPDADWGCFCKTDTPPAGASYMSVRLEAEDQVRGGGCEGPDRGLHCADYDALRLIEWETLDRGKPLTVPNGIDYVRTDGASPVQVTFRTIDLATDLATNARKTKEAGR